MLVDMASLPDMLVLRNMDEGAIDLMRRRVGEARERLEQIDPERSEEWSWTDIDNRSSGLARLRRGTSLSIYETDEVSGSVFTDQTMELPASADETGTAPGVAAATQLLDSFDAYLELPRVRIQQLDLPAVRLANPPPHWPNLARDYVAALCLMVSRCAALYTGFGRPELRPSHIGIIPPSPGNPGGAVDGGVPKKILAGRGAMAIANGVPRILFLTSSEQHGYVISPPEVLFYGDMPVLDAVQTMRILGRNAFAQASSRYLTPHFRR